MSRFIKFYYGMSGTFKATTINTEISNLSRPYIFMNSAIKQWKVWEKNLFHELNKPSDINLGLLHLCRLSDHVRESLNKKDIEVMYVERGVSDMMFYWSGLKDSTPIEDMVVNAVKQESSICKEGNYIPVKTLLIQKDQKFISDVILREPSRRECFPSVEQYLEAQDKYIEFTRKYNDISEEIIIEDAERYITNDLGLTFNINA